MCLVWKKVKKSRCHKVQHSIKNPEPRQLSKHSLVQGVQMDCPKSTVTTHPEEGGHKRTQNHYWYCKPGSLGMMRNPRSANETGA